MNIKNILKYFVNFKSIFHFFSFLLSFYFFLYIFISIYFLSNFPKFHLSLKRFFSRKKNNFRKNNDLNFYIIFSMS